MVRNNQRPVRNCPSTSWKEPKSFYQHRDTNSESDSNSEHDSNSDCEVTFNQTMINTGKFKLTPAHITLTPSRFMLKPATCPNQSMNLLSSTQFPPIPSASNQSDPPASVIPQQCTIPQSGPIPSTACESTSDPMVTIVATTPKTPHQHEVIESECGNANTYAQE